MSLKARVKVQETKGKVLGVVCPECGKETAHVVLTNVAYDDESPEGDVQVSDSYLTIMCRGCKTVSFCRESTCSEDYDEDGQAVATITLFPSRIARRPPLSDLYHLPPELQRVYEETRSGLMQNLPILVGIGIRAIVETVCNDKRRSARDLAGKIQQLVDDGFITRVDGDILHDLRFMGNEAAHKTKAHSQEELNLAFDAAEHLLDSVYLLPQRAQKLPRQPRKTVRNP